MIDNNRERALIAFPMREKGENSIGPRWLRILAVLGKDGDEASRLEQTTPETEIDWAYRIVGFSINQTGE